MVTRKLGTGAVTTAVNEVVREATLTTVVAGALSLARHGLSGSGARPWLGRPPRPEDPARTPAPPGSSALQSLAPCAPILALMLPSELPSNVRVRPPPSLRHQDRPPGAGSRVPSPFYHSLRPQRPILFPRTECPRDPTLMTRPKGSTGSLQ